MNVRAHSDLKEMQSWSLDRKIMVTQTRIIEWYQHYDGQVYVSFSGGKDSTVLLDIARKIYPDIEAVFVDTGLEYPEIREFVKSKDNVTWLKPEITFKKVIEKHGYPVISKVTSNAVHYARKNIQQGKNNTTRLRQLKGTFTYKDGKNLLSTRQNGSFCLMHHF